MRIGRKKRTLFDNDDDDNFSGGKIVQRTVVVTDGPVNPPVHAHRLDEPKRAPVSAPAPVEATTPARTETAEERMARRNAIFSSAKKNMDGTIEAVAAVQAPVEKRPKEDDEPEPETAPVANIVTAEEWIKENGIKDPELVELDRAVRRQRFTVTEQTMTMIRGTVRTLCAEHNYSTQETAIHMKRAGMIATWLTGKEQFYFGLESEYVAQMGCRTAEEAISRLPANDRDAK